MAPCSACPTSAPALNSFRERLAFPWAVAKSSGAFSHAAHSSIHVVLARKSKMAKPLPPAVIEFKTPRSSMLAGLSGNDFAAPLIPIYVSWPVNHVQSSGAMCWRTFKFRADVERAGALTVQDQASKHQREHDGDLKLTVLGCLTMFVGPQPLCRCSTIFRAGTSCITADHPPKTR